MDITDIELIYGGKDMATERFTSKQVRRIRKLKKDGCSVTYLCNQYQATRYEIVKALEDYD